MEKIEKKEKGQAKEEERAKEGKIVALVNGKWREYIKAETLPNSSIFVPVLVHTEMFNERNKQACIWAKDTLVSSVAIEYLLEDVKKYNEQVLLRERGSKGNGNNYSFTHKAIKVVVKA